VIGKNNKAVSPTFFIAFPQYGFLSWDFVDEDEDEDEDAKRCLVTDRDVDVGGVRMEVRRGEVKSWRGKRGILLGVLGMLIGLVDGFVEDGFVKYDSMCGDFAGDRKSRRTIDILYR